MLKIQESMMSMLLGPLRDLSIGNDMPRDDAWRYCYVVIVLDPPVCLSTSFGCAESGLCLKLSCM